MADQESGFGDPIKIDAHVAAHLNPLQQLLIQHSRANSSPQDSRASASHPKDVALINTGGGERFDLQRVNLTDGCRGLLCIGTPS